MSRILPLLLLIIGLSIFTAAQNPLIGYKIGAKTAIPYTQADIDYGQILSDKMDKEREVSKNSKEPMEPFRVIGDVYFVGVHNWGAYLLDTGDGLILIDTLWEDTAQKVQTNIEKLGFKMSDIKIILCTEAHGDHMGAVAYFHDKTKAKLMVMKGDAEEIEKGGDSAQGRGFPPSKVDYVLKDREQVKLGNKVLTAYHIPGHTLGSTTWYWQEIDNGKKYNVAQVCCWFTPANVVSDPIFPTSLLKKNWEILKSLPVDVPMPGIHTYHFDLIGKLEKLRRNPKENPFIDPQGYRGIIAHFEKEFEIKLAKQLKDGPPPPRDPNKPPPKP